MQLIGNNITVRDTIDAFSTTGSFPFNANGFDVTETNIAITDGVIFNADDAIAVQSGSHNELFQYGTIGYQTHGMSIGSLAKGQGAYVNVSDITAVNAVHAARFKSWQRGLGLAQNISWHRIRAYNVSFPVFVLHQLGLARRSSRTGSWPGVRIIQASSCTISPGTIFPDDFYISAG